MTGGGDESDDDSDGGEESKGDGKNRADGVATPSSESSEDVGAFKTPLGVPRKSSKQTTNSSGMLSVLILGALSLATFRNSKPYDKNHPQQKETGIMRLKQAHDGLVEMVMIPKKVAPTVKILMTSI
ncbi:unnamed protein product [Strongylus vulgaris]|uniref:Uncharacterized protein n=1 Tax=Strongylus vulgaris TaxID=40348 RepID=A0A3P7J216_STRVU|nr:unnamed protein product [Strongylus vulgaris]